MINLTEMQKKINHLLLLMSGLSGIYSCSLVPFFFIKYFYNKNKYNFYNLIILTFTNIIQIFLILKSKINNTIVDSSLSFELNSDLFVNLIYNFFAKSIMARQLTHIFWNKFSFFANENYYLFSLIIFILIFSIVLIKFKKIFIFLKNDKVILNLIGIFIIISTIIIIGSINNQVSGRYAVIPGALLLLIYLHLYCVVNKYYLKLFFLSLVFLSMITGLYEFRPPTDNVKYQYLKLLDCINCPIWSEEIQKWKKDKNHIISIWPYPGRGVDYKNLIID